MKLAIIVGLGVIAVSLAIWLICRPKKIEETRNPVGPEESSNPQTDNSDDNSSVAASVEPKSNDPPAIPHKENARNKRKECRECVTLCVEVLGLIGLSIYAYITYGMWTEVRQQTIATQIAAKAAESAAKTAQGQLSEMQAEQRAWISITKDSGVESLSIDSVNNQLDAKLKITLQNTGRNPAVFVSVNAEMTEFAIPHGGSMPDWQAAVYKIDVRTYGFTMFPNSIQPTFEVTVSSKIPTQAVVVPSIAACVIYHDAVTGKIHHTPLGFQLMKIPRPGVPCCGIVMKSLPLQSSEIMTRLWTLGSLPPD